MTSPDKMILYPINNTTRGVVMLSIKCTTIELMILYRTRDEIVNGSYIDLTGMFRDGFLRMPHCDLLVSSLETL